MEPALSIGGRVLVEKVSSRFSAPDRGDVVVFKRNTPGITGSDEADDDTVFEDVADAFRELFGFPTGTSRDFIKRVVAVEGDTIEGRNDTIFVNGEPVEEDYLPDGILTGTFAPFEVGRDEVFVMGDNRNNSDDSRNFGPIDEDDVVGRAVLVVWPPSDFGSL